VRRTELFHGPPLLFCLVCLNLGALAMLFWVVTLLMPFLVTIPSGDRLTLGSVEVLCIGALCIAAGVVCLWRRKRSTTRPAIIIEDAGLWLEWMGKLMPWSEIQSVRFEPHRRGSTDPPLVVVWRNQPYGVPLPVTDRDGWLWRASSVYKEIKACWERNRAG
jgi:hypothetical protein